MQAREIGQLTVRNGGAEFVRALKARAAAHGRSAAVSRQGGASLLGALHAQQGAHQQ